MISFCIYLTAFILVLSLIVIVHEGGHFLMARLCGVQVSEFSIGFGKTLCSFTDKKGTLWKIGSVPLGGYVKMLGDEDASSLKVAENVSDKDKSKMFSEKRIWQKALIVIAGPLMNYVLSIFLLLGLLWTFGEVVVPPVVGKLIPNMPAEKAGIKEGDRIISINGKEVNSYQEIGRLLNLDLYAKDLEIKLVRDGSYTFVHIPFQEQEEGRVLLGIQSSGKYEVMHPLNFIQALGKSVQIVYQITTDTLVYIGQILFEKRSPKDMRGPLGIAEASGDALLGGGLSLLMFIINISIAVGFMNLLPIPLLDGGHLIIYLCEAVFGKSISVKAQSILAWVGGVIIIGLFLFTMVLDIPRIIQRILG